MKKIISVLALATTLGFALPSTAKADHSGSSRVVSYLPCGRPVCAVYQVIGYDRCGHPVGQWVTQRQACGCAACNPRPVICTPAHGHGHGRPAYRGAPPPPHRGGIGIHFSFGR